MAARCAIVHDPGLKRYYQRKMKEKGGGENAHGVVLNAIKFKLWRAVQDTELLTYTRLNYPIVM